MITKVLLTVFFAIVSFPWVSAWFSPPLWTNASISVVTAGCIVAWIIGSGLIVERIWRER